MIQVDVEILLCSKLFTISLAVSLCIAGVKSAQIGHVTLGGILCNCNICLQSFDVLCLHMLILLILCVSFLTFCELLLHIQLVSFYCSFCICSDIICDMTLIVHIEISG